MAAPTPPRFLLRAFNRRFSEAEEQLADDPPPGLNYSIQPRCGYSRRQRLPVYLRLEGRCGLIDRTLGVLAANQHQADW
jgi:hypothetical protein